MNILITGGAGYIGSHVAKQVLEETDFDLTVVDNLSTGSQKTLHALQTIRKFEFKKLDLKEFLAVDKFLAKNSFDSIIHFAASIVVPESVENPLKYYLNNTVNTTNLIQCAVKHKIKQFIFSSTAATYGEPSYMPKSGLNEKLETKPINPYGFSKLMSEQILKDTALANPNFKYVIFRYFNVTGADMYYKDGKLAP